MANVGPLTAYAVSRMSERPSGPDGHGRRMTGVELRLYNTMGRRVETFVPLKVGEVGLYCCGPTVYNYAHIGNLRTYVFEDVLRRTLEHAG